MIIFGILLNNQPTEIIINKNKYWKLNENFHREDGPAIEYSDGRKEWWLYGKRHRVDGPAIVYSDGGKYWFLNGFSYTYEKWFNALTPEQQENYLWNLNE